MNSKNHLPGNSSARKFKPYAVQPEPGALPHTCSPIAWFACLMRHSEDDDSVLLEPIEYGKRKLLNQYVPRPSEGRGSGQRKGHGTRYRFLHCFSETLTQVRTLPRVVND